MIGTKTNNKEEKNGFSPSDKQTNNGKVSYKKNYRRIREIR